MMSCFRHAAFTSHILVHRIIHITSCVIFSRCVSFAPGRTAPILLNMTDQQQRDRDARDIEGRSSFVRSLMEAQASLEAARRGGGGAAAGPGGAHVGVGAAGAALEVLAHMDSAASEGESTSVLLNRVDEFWGPGGREGGSNIGPSSAAAAIGSSGDIGQGYLDEEQVREPQRTPPHTRPPPPKPRRGRPPPLLLLLFDDDGCC